MKVHRVPVTCSVCGKALQAYRLKDGGMSIRAHKAPTGRPCLGDQRTDHPARRVEKMIRDGKVAVLYSPGFGAGWSTWADAPKLAERLLFDRRLVELLEAGDRDGVAALAETFAPYVYTGGVIDLTIAWLDEGTAFRLEEYDGSESFRFATGEWFIA